MGIPNEEEDIPYAIVVSEEPARPKRQETQERTESPERYKNSGHLSFPQFFCIVFIGACILVSLYILTNEEPEEEVLKKRCKQMKVGDKLKFSDEDYITLVFATKMSVDQ
eukprot:snap_masked-scaffold_83-processed-gene-0.25-mRNA-1 protein AED:1.00 eAED:1.00 QI:0/-1/0/0/-1/1/1/0/109